MSSKIHDQFSKLTPEREELFRKQEKIIGPQGFAGSHIDEPKPAYNKADCEKIIEGKTNSRIVFGRDRSASLRSIGFTESGMIDLVAGAGGSHASAQKVSKTPDADVMLDPNFYMDAARVYLTQRGDIDNYFSLAKGSEVEKASQNASAVGIKADHVRLIGRRHVKIVTGPSHNAGGEERKASGGKIETPAGRIDLIAGNFTEPETKNGFSFVGKGMSGFKEQINKLQPIPKGENLVDLLIEILDALGDVAGFAFDNSNKIAELSGYLSTHFHELTIGPFPVFVGPPLISSAGPATIPPRIIAGQSQKIMFQYNMSMLYINYLAPGVAPKYINSRHVNTT